MPDESKPTKRRLRCRLGIHDKTYHELPEPFHSSILESGGVGSEWRCRHCEAHGLALLMPRLYPGWPIKGRR